jgi:hypothetical protein
MSQNQERKTKMRDLRDINCDDGLTPKEALDVQKVRPIGFLGKDILAIQKDVNPAFKDSKAYRAELAREFREAIEAYKPELRALLQETTCEWCGVEVRTVDDHKTVDREPMCNACVNQYFPEGIER